MLSRSCDDAFAVAARVESAGKAFGALRKCVFASSSVSAAAKAAAYEGIVLAILLFGSESWCLPETVAAAPAAHAARALRAHDVPRDAQAHVEAPHLDRGPDAQARA